TGSLVGSDMPNIARFQAQGAQTRIVPAFPAVTCTAQSNYLTGAPPSRHGIVGNGWYDRALAEVHFWKQSNHLVAGPEITRDLGEFPFPSFWGPAAGVAGPHGSADAASRWIAAAAKWIEQKYSP